MIKVEYPAGDSGMIAVFDGLISTNTCQQFLNEVKPLWSEVSYQGKTMGGIDIRTKNSFDMTFSKLGFLERNIDYSTILQNIESLFLNAFTQAITSYQNKYRSLHNWLEIEDTGFQVQCYNKCGGWYREHIDSFPGTESQNRVVSGLIYLNDVDDGGETGFPLHNIEVEARAGRIVLFPSNFTHPHQGKTPLSNDKWIVNTFFVYNEHNYHGHNHDDHKHAENHL